MSTGSSSSELPKSVIRWYSFYRSGGRRSLPSVGSTTVSTRSGSTSRSRHIWPRQPCCRRDAAGLALSIAPAAIPRVRSAGPAFSRQSRNTASPLSRRRSFSAMPTLERTAMRPSMRWCRRTACPRASLPLMFRLRWRQRWLYEHHLRVPDDICLIGHEDSLLYGYSAPPLTAIVSKRHRQRVGH